MKDYKEKARAEKYKYVKNTKNTKFMQRKAACWRNKKGKWVQKKKWLITNKCNLSQNVNDFYLFIQFSRQSVERLLLLLRRMHLNQKQILNFTLFSCFLIIISNYPITVMTHRNHYITIVFLSFSKKHLLYLNESLWKNNKVLNKRLFYH